MTYDQQILSFLMAVGERGISVSSLTKHVYNQNCTFFFQPDLQEVKNYVQKFLLKNSKSAQSLIERTGRRGYYRLNTDNSSDARQLLLNFSQKSEVLEQPKEETVHCDLSLSLFGDNDGY